MEAIGTTSLQWASRPIIFSRHCQVLYWHLACNLYSTNSTVIASVGHAIFAATMIGLGILGLIQGGFTPVWAPVPDSLPARQVLVYLCACISLASGIGLLWQRTAAPAARLLLAYLLLWFLLLRVREIILSPTFG